MRRDPRRLGDHDGVDVADPPPVLRGEVARALHEDRAVGALPGRVARREMVADRAEARGAEDRVGQRVQQRVPVGVPLEPGVVRDRPRRRDGARAPRRTDARRTRFPRAASYLLSFLGAREDRLRQLQVLRRRDLEAEARDGDEPRPGSRAPRTARPRRSRPARRRARGAGVRAERLRRRGRRRSPRGRGSRRRAPSEARLIVSTAGVAAVAAPVRSAASRTAGHLGGA